MRGSKVVAVLAVFVLIFSLGMADEATEGEGKKKKKRSGAKKGAILGGATGLALGALTGDASLAAKGAAAGAVTGAASGAWYDYDQQNQDDRTEMLADAISSNDSGGNSGGGSTGAAAQPTVGDVGRQQFENFRGDWKIDVWVLDGEGDKVLANGRAKGIAAGDNGVRILYNDIRVEGVDRSLDGVFLLKYDPGQGFFLENSFTASDDTLYFVGEYVVDKNKYDFFLTDSSSDEMITPGMIRSAMRVEIRIGSPSMWVAEAYIHLDGKEVQVQSYRFTKS